MIDTLLNRSSHPARHLMEPAPNDEQLAQILRCGLTAPDHAAMRPWRFITIRGDARNTLGEIFAAAAVKDDPNVSERKIEAIKDKPLRSPLIVVIVATITPDHPKTPEIEQVLSAGAAATHIQMAANSCGFGAIWLTGPNAYFPDVKAALGVAEKDHIIGYIYIGTPSQDAPVRDRPDLADHLSEWTGH